MAKLRGFFGVVVVTIMAVSLLTGCDSSPVVLTGTVTAQPPGAAGTGTGVTRPFAAGVDVVAFSDAAETEVAHTTTNLFGGFAFHDSQVPDGTYRLRVHGIWWGGDSWSTATPVVVSAAHPATVDVPLTRVGKVSGVIVDAARSGVSGVPVWAVDATGATVATTFTDTQGAFTLGLLAVGDYTVHFKNATGAVAAGGTTPVTFAVDDDPSLDHSNDGIAGRLDLATGRQLALDHVTAIGGGGSHTCAARADGTVWCWGYNVDGGLGNGTFDNFSTMPVQVTGITDATAVAAGQGHSCALRRGGTVSCWGFNEDGELGNPAPWPRSPTPVAVNGIDDAVAITAGAFHTCAIRDGGSVACWGYDHSGQLGDGATVSSPSPVTVTGIDDAVSIAGGRYHTCAVHRTGTVSCWGSNDYGAIGNGTDHNYFTTPVAVTGLSDAVEVVAGDYDTCALRVNGRIACWGANFHGGLGDGTFDDSNVPVAVSGITDATAVSAGSYHTCAVHVGGTVSCWGYNPGGVLWSGSDGDLKVPEPMENLTDAVAIGSGQYHSCVIRADTTASCWGGNGFGELGDGTTTDPRMPVTVLAG
jgi:alpha-tubulin suppressor-like RCC1 family protein